MYGQVLTLSAIFFRELLSQILDLAVREFERKTTTVRHRMEFLDRLGCHEHLHESVNEAHDSWDIDEELFLEKLRIVLGKDLDDFRAGRLDIGRLAEEADGFVIMNLEDLVRIIVGSNWLCSV